MSIEFPVSGIELSPLLPLVVAFLIGLVSSMAGATGAFLLLPVQMILFGFTSPSVTATNHVYFRYGSDHYSIRIVYLLLYAFIVGLVSGVYGMGGGALHSSFLVDICGVPVHGTAGAAMTTSFVASLVGTISDLLFARFSSPSISAAPDLMFAFILGIGGLAGTGTGARMQKRVPAPLPARFLGILMLVIGFRYLTGLVHLLHGSSQLTFDICQRANENNRLC